MGTLFGQSGTQTFDCGIIFIHEVALDELDGQAGFTHATSPDHDQLVFSQKLCQERVSNFHPIEKFLGADAPLKPSDLDCGADESVSAPFSASLGALKPALGLVSRTGRRRETMEGATEGRARVLSGLQQQR